MPTYHFNQLTFQVSKHWFIIEYDGKNTRNPEGTTDMISTEKECKNAKNTKKKLTDCKRC